MAADAVLSRPPPHLEGFLYKQDPPQGLRIGRQGWKHRYFVVIKDRIHYYTTKEQYDKQHDPKGVILLPKVNEVYETTFQSVPKKKHINSGFAINTNERTYNLVAETPEEMHQWISDLPYIKLYWSKQEKARNTVIDEQKYAQLAMLDEEMQEDTIESTYCLYEDDEGDAIPSALRAASHRSSAGSSSSCIPIKVWLVNGKNHKVILPAKTGTGQDIIDKLSTTLSSSACNIWQVDKEGNVRLLEKGENVVLLRPITHSFFVAELSYRVLVVFFGEMKFEPLLVPFNINAQKVVSLDAVKAQLDTLGVSNAGLFLRNSQGIDQYFSPDDEPCDIFFGRDDKNQLYVQTGIGRLFVKNKALGADMRLKRETVRGRGSFKAAAAEKKKLETLARAEAQRCLLIKQVEEKKKQETELEQARRRRDALQEYQKKQKRMVNSDPLVMFEEYFEESAERRNTRTTSSSGVSDTKQQRPASSDQREQTKHDLSAVKVDSQATGRKTDKTETDGRTKDPEKATDSGKAMFYVDLETTDTKSEQKESGSVEKKQESTKKAQPKVEDDGKEQKVIAEKENSSSTFPDPDSSDDKQKSPSVSSVEETRLLEEETLRLAGSAAADRRSRNLNRRSHVGSVAESVEVKAESGKKETETDVEASGFVYIASPERMAGRRGRERTPDENKAAAAIARQSVRKHKSPSPVASGSAQAAAMLASGKVLPKTEDSDLFPKRRAQLSRDTKWRRSMNKEPDSETKEKPKTQEKDGEPVPRSESRSDFFGAKPSLTIPTPGQRHSQSNPLATGRGSWKDQMDEDERLNVLFDRSQQATTDVGEDSIEELKEKANDLEKIPVKAPKLPHKPMEVDLDRLFSRQNSSVSDGSATCDDQALEVKSPALLRIALKQSTQSDGSSASKLNKRMDFISLSGTLLRNDKGVWSLEPGSAFHTPMPESDNCEVLTLPPHIRTTFSHATKQWNVKSTERPPVQQQPLVLPPAPLSPQVQPLGGQKTEARPTRIQSTGNGILRSLGQPRFVNIHVDLTHKRAIVRAVEYAVDTILRHFSVTRNAQEKERLGDDSRTVTIGHLVRGHLCSAIAAVLADGLKLFRMGGLMKNNLWHVVQASVGKSGNEAMATAVRVVDDLKKHPHMTDDNVRYRTFICAALNHHFLENWLIELTKKTDFLQKYYESYSLLSLSSGPASSIYNELLISVQPLNTLPFRLFSSFEAQQAALQRQMQQTQSPMGRDSVDQDNERRYNGATSPVAVVASTDVEAQKTTDGPSSSSRDALVESLTQIQQKQAVEVAGEPEDMTVEDQGAKKSGRLWGAIVAVTSSVSQATGDAKHSIQSYWSKLKTSMQTSDSWEVRALYDNRTDDSDELQFARGDVLVVEEKVNDDWLICRLGNRTGMVPANYVEPV